MDPITAAIIAAATAGAASGLTDTAKTAIADAYGGLKALLTRRLGGQSDVVKAMEGVEKKPDSDSRKGVLEEEVKAAHADADPELLKAAQALAQIVAQHGSTVQSVANTQIGDGNVNVQGAGNVITYNAPDAKKK